MLGITIGVLVAFIDVRHGLLIFDSGIANLNGIYRITFVASGRRKLLQKVLYNIEIQRPGLQSLDRLEHGDRGIGMVYSELAFVLDLFAPQAAGSGTAEVKTILGGFNIRNFLGFQTLVAKFVALPLTVASGLAVGKEGPMIHLACCVGNLFPRLFPKYWRNEARKREILSASAAAGVAVAFGAPIGGVLFSLEELSSFFPSKTMLRSFFCALVSCVVLQFIDPFRGKRVLFSVSYSRDWHLFETIFFIILGVFGGLTGALVIRMHIWVGKLKILRRLKMFPLYEVLAVASVTASIGYLNPFTRIDSSELLEFLFKECSETAYNNLCRKEAHLSIVMLLVVALVFRLAMTIVSLSVKPSLPLFSACHPDSLCVTPGMYALLGAIGALGGVTRMTVSLTVIMFELTGTLNYIIPCMVTLLVAKVTGDAFGKGGISDVMIRQKKYPYLDATEDEALDRRAFEIMTPMTKLLVLPASGTSVSQIEEILTKKWVEGYPVVASETDNLFVGYVTRSDLELEVERAKAVHRFAQNIEVYFSTSSPVGVESELVDTGGRINLMSRVNKTPITVHPHVHVELVVDLFKKLGPRHVLVLDNGCLEGIITKKDLLRSLNEHVHHASTANLSESLLRLDSLTSPATELLPDTQTQMRFYDKVRYKKEKKILRALQNQEDVSFAEAADVLKTYCLGQDKIISAHVQCQKPEEGSRPIRGEVTLPKAMATDQKSTILVFSKGAEAEKAKELGADIVGAEELIAQIEKGQIAFDKCIATKQMFPQVVKIAKILGPRGLMPSPARGTVSDDVEAMMAAMQASSKFEIDSDYNINLAISRTTWSQEDIFKNLRAFLKAVVAAKPAKADGMKIFLDL
ncbi:glycerol ethanol, ferric requiring protein [Blyttiomyces sp. JEL0837]|nr:glycerol ethanol, ferric requiring protein [Blyttiomyces sp. JEL0837]